MLGDTEKSKIFCIKLWTLAFSWNIRFGNSVFLRATNCWSGHGFLFGSPGTLVQPPSLVFVISLVPQGPLFSVGWGVSREWLRSGVDWGMRLSVMTNSCPGSSRTLQSRDSRITESLFIMTRACSLIPFCIKTNFLGGNSFNVVSGYASVTTANLSGLTQQLFVSLHTSLGDLGCCRPHHLEQSFTSTFNVPSLKWQTPLTHVPLAKASHLPPLSSRDLESSILLGSGERRSGNIGEQDVDYHKCALNFTRIQWIDLFRSWELFTVSEYGIAHNNVAFAIWDAKTTTVRSQSRVVYTEVQMFGHSICFSDSCTSLKYIWYVCNTYWNTHDRLISLILQLGH